MEAQEHATDEALVAAFREDGMPHHLDILFLRHLEKVRAMLYQMVLNDASRFNGHAYDQFPASWRLSVDFRRLECAVEVYT